VHLDWGHCSINSKRKTITGIGDLNSIDAYRNSVTVSTNIGKAEVLGNFFSSVFAVEELLPPAQTLFLSDQAVGL